MKTLVGTIASWIAFWLIAQFLPGVSIDTVWTMLIALLLFAIVNAVLKPILLVLTIPINMLTLGLFTFVINGALLFLVSYFLTGFEIDTILTGIIFALIFSFVKGFIKVLEDVKW